jgi:hypothetical protein
LNIKYNPSQAQLLFIYAIPIEKSKATASELVKYAKLCNVFVFAFA